ncbi:MAG: hypothetical protein RSE64_03985 [Oscillospiraceae bacterium]
MKNSTLVKMKWLKGICILSASVVVICGLTLGAYAYFATSSYVSLDVNPSIEYTLNAFDQVLSVKAVNDDGAQILKDVNLKDFEHATIDDAIAMTLAEITKEGYFDGKNKGGVVIATSGKKTGEAEILATRLKELVSAQCLENKHDVSVEAMTVDKAKLDEAKALGVTPGKLLLVQKLQAEHPEANNLSTEEWLKKSVKDIMAEVARTDKSKDADADDADDTDEDEDDAAEDAEDLAEDAKEAEEEAAEEAAELAKDKKEAAKEKAEKEKDAAAEAADKKKDEADKAKDKAEEEKEAAEDAAEDKAEAEEEAKEAAEEEKEDAEDADENNKPKPDTKPETKPDTKPETKPDTKPENKPENKPEPKPETKPSNDSDSDDADDADDD